MFIILNLVNSIPNIIKINAHFYAQGEGLQGYLSNENTDVLTYQIKIYQYLTSEN